MHNAHSARVCSFKFGFALIPAPWIYNKCSHYSWIRSMIHRELFLYSIRISKIFYFHQRHSMQSFSFTCARQHPKWTKNMEHHSDGFVFNLDHASSAPFDTPSRFFLLSSISHSLLHFRAQHFFSCAFHSMDCFYFNPFIIVIRLALRPTS